MAKKLGSSMSMLAAVALGACAGTREAPQTAWDTTRRTETRVPVAPIVTTTPPMPEFRVDTWGNLEAMQNVPAPVPEHEVRHTFTPKVTRVDPSGSVPAERHAVSSRSEAQADADTGALAASTLTDSQIAEALTTMQVADIAETEIVAARTKNAHVKAFAERVQADTQTQKESTELAKSSPDIANARIRDTPIAADLRVKASKQLTLAQLAAPSELDQAFLRSQIEQAEERIELIDARLLPDATDAKLQTELKQSRAHYTRQRGEAAQVMQAMQAIEGP